MERVHIRFVQAGIALRKGDLPLALAIAEPALQQAAALAVLFGLATFRVQTAQMLMLAGRHGQARELLALAADQAVAMYDDITRIHALVNLAWSLFDAGDDGAAAEALDQGLAIGARRDYMNCHPWWTPEVMSRLLTRVLARCIETDCVRWLIRRRDVAPETAQVLDWPWPLRIHALGGFRVEVDGVPLAFEGKAQARPRVLSDVKLSLHPGRVWTDVKALEGFVETLTRLDGRDAGQCHALANELLQQYPGEFLAHERTQP